MVTVVTSSTPARVFTVAQVPDIHGEPTTIVVAHGRLYVLCTQALLSVQLPDRKIHRKALQLQLGPVEVALVELGERPRSLNRSQVTAVGGLEGALLLAVGTTVYNLARNGTATLTFKTVLECVTALCELGDDASASSRASTSPFISRTKTTVNVAGPSSRSPAT